MEHFNHTRQTMGEDTKAVFHSFLSDNNNQDAATTACHTDRMIKMNIDANIIKPGKSTIWEQTDGCAEQYR